jgi:hypothetical protein
METIKYRGFDIEIIQDNCPENPREWDNLGTMVCWHRRYNLGDKHNFYEPQDFIEHFKVVEWFKEEGGVVLNLYLYDHSGITISTGTFSHIDSHGWDWGQVGFIYVTKEKIRKEYGWKRITKKRRQKLVQYLESEVREYDDYLTGNVYGFNVEVTGDSCYGFFGTDWENNGLLSHAKSSIDYYIEKENERIIKERAHQHARLKDIIKKKVPLLSRRPANIEPLFDN